MVKKLIIVIIAAMSLAACTQAAKVKDNSLSLTADNVPVINNRQPAQTTQPIAVTPPMQTKPPALKPTIQLSDEEIKTMSEKVTIQTSKGSIVIKLYPDVAPQTVNNFLTKAKSDYYKDLTFHRVESWVIQGGDPLGNGTGGGKMPTELSDTPFKIGSVGVARGGDIRVSNDSQFFICTDDCAWLTGQYTNFGEVIEGMDIATSIAVGDRIESITTESQ